MAQPLFDDHPIGQYLREAGEAELMPGGCSDFLPEAEDIYDTSSEDGEQIDTCPTFLKEIFEALHATLSANSSSAFVERFKYSVISSSLLSSSLAAQHTLRGPRLPGHHSRGSSLNPDTNETSPQPVHSLTPDSHYYIFSLALALVTIVFGAGYYFMSLVLAGSATFLYISSSDSTSKHDMTPSLDTLNDLIAAGNVWDSVVQEAITTLEKEEQNTYTSPAPSSPSSSLRVALHSTLLTTQTQCDNVRQLLSALASHSEISQLSEMYAPPSPVPSMAFFPPSSSARHSSLPTSSSYTRIRTSSAPTSIGNKRSTWNGSYSSLANAGSPTMQITRRREKRRSDLSALLNVTGALTSPQSHSAPPTPSSSPHLEGVLEEDGGEEEQELSPYSDDESNKSGPTGYKPFGLAALDLHRKRRSMGLEAFGLSSHPHSPTSPHNFNVNATVGFPSTFPRSPKSPRFSTVHAGSKFTSINAPRHPLSLSSLHLALQNALASKRYACSHLLALRFTEEGDDEAYWEDVRSVMALLTSALVDASARLTEALEQVDRQRLVDETPSPAGMHRDVNIEDLLKSTETKIAAIAGERSRTMQQMGSFAPMPSHLARFAAHVDAISSALDDAREHLEECVAALRKDMDGDASESEEREGSRSSLAGDEMMQGDELCAKNSKHPSVQAYERLRRELGLALRECERGRERLLDIVSPRLANESDDEERDENLRDLPALAHDGSDESSDKHESSFPVEYEAPSTSSDNVTVVDLNLDDVTAHLLLTSSSHHLPSPGVEQVFEADSGNVGAFKRERSKLSREERIEMTKKARESGQGLPGLGINISAASQLNHRPGQESLGPGDEVVQELKDVIWKVGERRRKMTDGQVHNVVPQPINPMLSDSSQ